MRVHAGHGFGIPCLVPTSLGVARKVFVPARITGELCCRRRPPLLRRRLLVRTFPPSACEAMAPHIQFPYATCSRTFGGANGLHRHMQVHHHEHMNVADAVLTDLEGPVHDPDNDSDSGGDAGGGAGAWDSAGDVSAGGADDGGDAGPSPARGGWSSSRSAPTTTTDDEENPPDERAWSSGRSTSESDDGSNRTQPVTDSDDDYESTDDTLAPHSRAADNRQNVSSVFVHSLRAQAPVEMHGAMDNEAFLCGRVLAWYHSLRDADRAEPVFSGRGDIADLPRLDTPCLHRVFTYVCTANGPGLGREQTNDFYSFLSAVERGSGGGEPFAERFPSKEAFWKAVRNEKRRTVEALGWRSAPTVIANKTYHLRYRDALNVAQALVRHADVEQLQWDGSGLDDADMNEDHVWSGPFNSAAFFDAHEDVTDTLPEGTQVLGPYGYSDSTVLNGTGGTLTLAPFVVHMCLLHLTVARA